MRLTALVAVLCILVVRSALAEGASATSQPAVVGGSQVSAAYLPARIEELVRSGVAKPHGAQFANQGLGCQSYLWKDSPEHQVFFFARDGVFYGEYRDERSEDGRSVEIIEHYLTVEARSIQAKAGLAERRELPFIRKTTRLRWENKIRVGCNVTWQFITCGQDGTVLETERPETVRMMRRDVALVVPAKWHPKGVEYYMEVLRPEASRHERALGERCTMFSNSRIPGVVMIPDACFFGMEKLVEGRCTFTLEGPESRPGFVFELHERVPNPPNDALRTAIRTKRVASMAVNEWPAGDGPVVFEP